MTATGTAPTLPLTAKASLAAAALLCATLFLLSADHLFVAIGGNKIKYGYFLLLALWLTRPRAMANAALDALARMPRWPFLIVLPVAIAVATSSNVARSLLWTLWLGFDALTILTVYAYLTAHRFTAPQIVNTAACALGLIALGGLAQFIAIYVMHQVVLMPQKHFDLYRINGLAGWPHFLCIFSFLLLPILAAQERLSWLQLAIVALTVFVLVQSTAKTGWVLFVALGALLLWFDRRLFNRNFLFLLLPLTVIALLIPTPPANTGAPPLSGSEKVQVFAEDLDLSNKSTSGVDRVLINQLGLRVFLRHPWFGVGPKAYDTYMFTRFDSELPGASRVDANGGLIAKNENIWIEWLAECGLVFTLFAALLVVRALWVPAWSFRNSLHFGAWLALVLYFGLSGQVSQTGLLTMVYAVAGIYFRARDLPHMAQSPVFSSAERRVPFDSRTPLVSHTRPGT